MNQYIDNYQPIDHFLPSTGHVEGNSVCPKAMIFHILNDRSGEVDVLDIGFGSGSLGALIKANPETAHWSVDGIDGWEPNCQNPALHLDRTYRNVWHGLAQELSADRLSKYRIICLLDVVEHLTADTAKWLVRTLLSSLGPDSYLFLSTPLWFYPQDPQQEGDLEEHLIGVPASSIMALCPHMYAVSPPLVGGFVLSRRSLDFVEFFQPTADKSFSFEKGQQLAAAVGMKLEPNVAYTMP
jgi:2-polyprenyl-3-methyl-5-hydroxy-6-metoxy-1,4-benzoquinol methylase